MFYVRFYIVLLFNIILIAINFLFPLKSNYKPISAMAMSTLQEQSIINQIEVKDAIILKALNKTPKNHSFTIKPLEVK